MPRRPEARRARPTRPTRPSRELPQEADIVLVEQFHVGDAVAEHGHALDAEAEGEASVLLAVVAHVGEDARVDHAAAAQLDPAGALAQAAASGLSAAEGALHVHLGAGLDEREVRRAEADAQAGAEEPV